MDPTNSKEYPDNYYAIAELAAYLLRGPRSITLASDPTGLHYWLDPVVRLKLSSSPLDITRAVAVYCVSRMMDANDESLVVVRDATWRARADKEGSKKQSLQWPSIGIAQTPVTGEDRVTLDALLRDLDESQSSFPFPIEGLYVCDPAAGSDQPNATVVRGVSYVEMSRLTRFCYVEMRWALDLPAQTRLDRAWRRLFDYLSKISSGQKGKPAIEAIEKYEIEPGSLASLLGLAPNQAKSPCPGSA